MERRAARAPAPARRGYDHPSFSSTLLDIIYRSIDDESELVGAASERLNGGTPQPSYSAAAAATSRRTTTSGHKASVGRSTAATAMSSERATYRRRGGVVGARFPPASPSSSSENSSYGGFSSSEPESATPHPAIPLPIRTGCASAAPTRSSGYRSNSTGTVLPSRPHWIPPPEAAKNEEKKKKSGSIWSKFRDLRKSKAPTSPGARLAAFLNSLFAAATVRKQKALTSISSVVAGGRRGDESACSTSSSYSWSCLIKTPSSRGRPPAPPAESAAKRSVRFNPVSVIVEEDLRQCGQKSVYDAADRSRLPAAAGRKEQEAKKMMEELLRVCEEEDEEEEEEESDTSSDLFELENLAAIRRGTGYRDELPVYETTTDRHINRPISHNFSQ